jgi:hypothetical protein
MRLNSWIALLGALVAAAGIAGIYFGLGISWVALAVVVGLALISYIVGAAGAASLRATNGFGEFMRGWLVGSNAGLNGFLGFALLDALAGPEAGVVAGASLGLLNLIAVFRPVSQSEVYQGIIGWLNWVTPMSWLVVVLGLVFYLVAFLGHAFTAGRVPYLRIQGLAVDWKTGTFFMRGGLIANLNPIDTAFNMGNFSFVDYKSSGWHMEHEAGHTLNLAAFGSLFHLIGALDENVTGRGANAFSERIAESNDSGGGGTNIPMWA